MDIDHIKDANGSTIRTTLVNHTASFNSQNRIMAALRDYYDETKSDNPELIAKLREDFNASVIIGSDMIQYAADSLEATITSYHGSTVTTPQERKVIAPIYSSGPYINDVLASEDGLKYLQVLFDTEDDADTIKTTLTALSGKPPEQMRVWTPDRSSRTSTPDRAAFLYYNSDVDFHVDGDFSLYNIGRARGVQSTAVGGARANIFHEKQSKHPAFSNGINKDSKCVYLANLQETEDYSKYSGLFMFFNQRFLYSMTCRKIIPQDESDITNKIAGVLATDGSTSDKITVLEKEFDPVYAHLQKYTRNDGAYALVDDSESFKELSR